MKQTRIFLSYARKDVAKVNTLYEDLKKYGFSPWQDHKDIKGNKSWANEVVSAIKDSIFLVTCISKHSINKRTGGVTHEIGEVLNFVKLYRKGSIYVVPVRLEEVDFPKEFVKYKGIDLYKSDGLEAFIKSLRFILKQLGIKAPLNLRSTPIKKLTPEEVAQMIRNRNFFDSLYWPGTGIYHDYQTKSINGDMVIVDHTTGLMWQQSGSKNAVQYDHSKSYINKLNMSEFAGFDDWRLPTLEEAMSLVEPQKSVNGLYISDVFDQMQKWIWTTDRKDGSAAWYVGFYEGYCDADPIDTDACIRAVR